MAQEKEAEITLNNSNNSNNSNFVRPESPHSREVAELDYLRK